MLKVKVNKKLQNVWTNQAQICFGNSHSLMTEHDPRKGIYRRLKLKLWKILSWKIKLTQLSFSKKYQIIRKICENFVLQNTMKEAKLKVLKKWVRSAQKAKLCIIALQITISVYLIIYGWNWQILLMVERKPSLEIFVFLHRPFISFLLTSNIFDSSKLSFSKTYILRKEYSLT